MTDVIGSLSGITWDSSCDEGPSSFWSVGVKPKSFMRLLRKLGNEDGLLAAEFDCDPEDADGFGECGFSSGDAGWTKMNELGMMASDECDRA